ncbi:otolith matrix protein OMM-64 [Biomphalaria pfeifferi]|uniref:Otolith matrix protein OMM-64 n=1 Tax=Biomphalaria pfeifferi TaxID=112525 RepID=A0AAD8BE92_BIOPF|nr:otolith matrix protein OMM-64 [Biomphalaria pfeifferi]
MAGYFPQNFYFGPRNWFYTNQTGVACYDDVHCEDQCCHDMDFGLPYCCSKYMGFVYLALMIGGGMVVAVLVIGCYICMTKKERELQAAAKLEAAKAANIQTHQTTDVTSSSSAMDGYSRSLLELRQPPPTYDDAIANYSRCQSRDPTLTPQQALDLVTMLVRQHSQMDQGASFPMLPPLVDVSALIAHHRQEHGQAGILPPVSNQISIDDKLPSYEQYMLRLGTESNDTEISHGTSSVINFQQQPSGSHIVDVDLANQQIVKEACGFTPQSDSHVIEADEMKQQLTYAHNKDTLFSHTLDVEITDTQSQMYSKYKLSNDSHFIDVLQTVQQLRLTEIIGQAVAQATDDVVDATIRHATDNVVTQAVQQVLTINQPATDSLALYEVESTCNCPVSESNNDYCPVSEYNNDYCLFSESNNDYCLDFKESFTENMPYLSDAHSGNCQNSIESISCVCQVLVESKTNHGPDSYISIAENNRGLSDREPYIERFPDSCHSPTNYYLNSKDLQTENCQDSNESNNGLVVYKSLERNSQDSKESVVTD